MTTWTADALVAALEQAALFAGVPAARLRKLAEWVGDPKKDVRVRELAAGEVAVRQGEYVGSIAFVLSGALTARVRRHDGAEHDVEAIGPGGSFGVLCAVGDRPQPATVRAAAASAVLECDRFELLSFVGSDAALRRSLDRAYRRAALTLSFWADPLFFDLPAADVEALIDASRQTSYARDDAIVAQGDVASDLCLVWSGHVRFERTRSDGTRRITGYAKEGYYFNEIPALEGGLCPETVVANDHVELIRVPRDAFRAIVDRRPALAARIRREIAARATRDDVTGTSVRLIDEAVGHGTPYASNSLVLNLSLCTRCGACASACHHLYGASRLTRQGKTFVLPGSHDRILVPNSCWHCTDPKCMTDCPTNALRRLPSGEVIVLQEICVGCEKCAKNCPWQNINMTPPRSAIERVVARIAARGHRAEPFEVDRTAPRMDRYDREGYRLRCPVHPDDAGDRLLLLVRLADAHVAIEPGCDPERKRADKLTAASYLAALGLEEQDLVPAERRGPFWARLLRWLNPGRFRLPEIGSHQDEKLARLIEEKQFGAKAVKCDLCQGHETAACVMACPYGAIDRVDLDVFLRNAREA